MTVFGDTLAMVLVVIGAALTGLLIWLLIRKYDREHGIDGASRRKADAGMSPLSGETASPVSPVCGHEVAPEGGPRETAQSTDALRMCPITAFSGKEPTPDEATAHGGGPVATSLPPKDPPGTSPITLSSGEEALLSSPPGDAPKVPPSGEAHLSEKSRPEAKKVPEHTKRSSTAGRSRESLQLTKERTSRDQHGKRKTKKPAAAPLNAIDSSAMKRKTKRKSSGMIPTRATNANIAVSPAQAALPNSDRITRLGADPSQGVRPHDDVNDPAIQELREEFAPRAPDGSHCAFPLPRHQSDQTPIPAELDIFSVEHSTSDAAAASRAAPRQESAQREGRVPTDVSSLPSDGATAGTAATTRGGNVAPSDAAAASDAAISSGSSALQGKPDDVHDPNARRMSHRTSVPKRDSPDKAEVPAELHTFSVEHSTLDKSEGAAPEAKFEAKPKQDL